MTIIMTCDTSGICLKNAMNDRKLSHHRTCNSAIYHEIELPESDSFDHTIQRQNTTIYPRVARYEAFVFRVCDGIWKNIIVVIMALCQLNE